MTGKEIRMGQLFNADSGRAFIVAFDHGQALPIPEGLGNPTNLLKRIVAGKPEGILLNVGMFSQCAHLFATRGAPTPIIRADWTTLDPRMKEEIGERHAPLIDPAYALAMGAGALCVYLIGWPKSGKMFTRNVQAVAQTIQAAHRVGLPVIVEATLWGTRNTNQKDPNLLRQICRIGAELGADAIKTEYVGNEAEQRVLIEEVGDIPVLTLGGAAGGTDAVQTAAAGAISAGAKGLIFGRNVWQVPDMGNVMKNLSQIVHGEQK